MTAACTTDQRRAHADYGKALLTAREAKGLTPRAFAKKLQPPVHPITIWRWETGRSYPPPDMRRQIKRLLKVEPISD